MSNIGSQETMEWKHIDWKTVNRYVEKMQKRIYLASKSDNVVQMRSLQKTLTRSYRARLLAVRKITQDNQGKSTAGVDGIKSLRPKQRMELARELKLDGKAEPTRRVEILKSNGKVRKLGIPTIRDRAKQALAKLALEPEWEAKFMETSYGFRPGRSTHDAIGDIFNQIRYFPDKIVLEADIKGCFDNIKHEYLLGELNTYPTMRKQIKAWLKSGVQIGFPKQEFEETNLGTPQGGVISPLLANIALHKLDVELNREKSSRKRGRKIRMIRYADDFVIFLKPGNFSNDDPLLSDKEKWIGLLNEIMEPIGLAVAHEKTHLITLDKGFDFLGFNVRQYKTGMYRSTKNNKGHRLGIINLIKPSKKSVLKHYHKCAEIIRRYENAPKDALIKKLNPVITGWCNYYKSIVSKKVFKWLDSKIFQRLMRMLHRKYPNRGSKWIKENCFDTIGNRNWAYGYLKEHSKTEVIRHTKVQGDKSPFDGDFKYWSQRMKRGYMGIPKKKQYLLSQQKGKCNYCKMDFSIQDINTMEIDHIKPKSLGGTDEYSNFQLLHRHCHDSKTANDGSLSRISQNRAAGKPGNEPPLDEENNNQSQNTSTDTTL